MKKIKLLLAAMAAMVTMGANAQSWTASEVGAGDFYLYNVGTGQFFTKGNGWGTQASITTDALATNAIKVSLAAVGDNYFICTRVGNDAYGLEHLSGGTCYTDQSRGKQSTWTFTVVAPNDNGPVYNIISADNHGGGSGKYLTAEATGTIVGPGTDGTLANAQWQIVAESETAAIRAAFIVRDAKDQYQSVRTTIVGWTTSSNITNADAAKATFNTALEAADAKVAAATTTAEVNEAIADLKAAGNTFLENVTIGGGLDITNAWITNPAPGISGNLTGWTNSGSPGLQAQLYEYWNVSAGTTKQTLSNLPKGAYKLTVIAYTRTDMQATLYAGDNKMNIATVASSVVNDRNGGSNWIAQGNGVNNLEFTLDEATASLEIGLIADNTTGDHWMCWRSFSLTYYGDPINLLKVQLTEAVSAFNALDATAAPSSIYEAQAQIVNDNNKAWSTVEEYNSAIAAINEATASIQAFITAKANLEKAVATANSYEGAIPSVAYAPISAALTEYNKSYNTVEEYEAATNAINSAVSANASSALVNAYKLTAKAWVLYNQTNYSEKTSGAKATFKALLDAIDEKTTAEDVATASADLPTALATFMGGITFSDNGFFDITDFFLANADFSAGGTNGQIPTGWESNYVSGQQANNIGYQGASYSNGDVKIAQFIEAWRPSGTLGDGYLRQTVSGLPEGKYVLEADAIAVLQSNENLEVTGSQLYITADGVDYATELNTLNNKPQHFATQFMNTGEGDVIFGLRTISATNNWLCADNFTVKFYGIDLAPYATNLATAVAEAEAVDTEVITEGAATAISSAISTYNKTWSTSKEYATAIAAIQSATRNAQATIAPLAEFNALKAKVVALTSVEGYTETVSGAANTFSSALSGADAEVNAAASAEEINTQIAAIKAAALTFLAGVRSDGAHPFDITYMITNPNFDNNNITGWTRTFDGGSANTRCHSNEFFDNNSFDFYQTLTDMPKGNYELKVQAFQRPGNAGTVYNAYINGNTSTDAVVYINEGETSVKHIASDAQDAPLYWNNEGNYPDDSRVGSEGAYKYFPNSMEGAEVWFAAGHYDNSILTAVEGTLKLGFKADQKTADGTWTLFDNFRLYFYGQSINVAMSETEAFTALADIEGANVTMVRNTKEGFNTVALPFDLDEDQTKAVFGDDAVVYAFSEESGDPNDATINFNSTDTKIDANVPVLVKATKAVSEITANNVTVKTGEAKVEGTNFDFVGNYGGEVTIAADDWFIGGGKLFQSTGATKIKGFRAYIKDKTNGASVKLFIDGVATGISEVNGMAAENGTIYNIAGQRVNKAQKGIFIVNGKKVVK